jgi:peptide-methionine (R)-S-oxide reductase
MDSVFLKIFGIFTTVLMFYASDTGISQTVSHMSDSEQKDFKTKDEAFWKARLTPGQYFVLRERGTERAFTGEYDDFNEEGIFVCAGCGNKLFDSGAKYDSGSGWPSFWDILSDENIEIKMDTSYGMKRREVRCASCGGHLGHVFRDGPKPTGSRYCINSAALRFLPADKNPKQP